MEECECGEGVQSNNLYASKLDKLERSLVSFPKTIRHELIYFFFKKLQRSHELFVINSVGCKRERYSDAEFLGYQIMRTHGEGSTKTLRSTRTTPMIQIKQSFVYVPLTVAHKNEQ